ncbi:MAG: thiol-disulfide oxidoreductase DCC family protein [Arenimonas sp.]
MNIAYPLRIYYDNSCPLCRTEMHTLKQYDYRQRLVLVDCSPLDFNDEFAGNAGYHRSKMMRLIHAMDANGRWLIGVPVFEAAYGATGITGMEKMWSNPMLRPIWDRIYPWIADHRMGLSKLGITKLFGWMVKRAAQKAAAKTLGCIDNICELE